MYVHAYTHVHTFICIQLYNCYLAESHFLSESENIPCNKDNGGGDEKKYSYWALLFPGYL